MGGEEGEGGEVGGVADIDDRTVLPQKSIGLSTPLSFWRWGGGG